MVVCSHVSAELGLRGHGGAGGVDLFFVISGFIIAYVASAGQSQFLTRRLIRIVPTYWVSTLVVFALVLAMPSMFHRTSADVGLLIRSLLFVPDSSSMQDDGFLYPTLIAGWTLNYEMYFYVIFAIALVMSRRRPTLIAIAMLLGILAVVQLTGLAHEPVARFYGYSIVVEFVFGMLAFHLVRYAEWRTRRAYKYLCLGGVVVGFVLLLVAEQRFGKAHRWLVSGVPAFVVVCSAVMLERIYDVRIRNKFIVLIGDASYALYLTHAYVVNGSKRIVIGPQQLSQPLGYVVGIGLLAASVAVAIAVFRYFERPLLASLKRQLIHR